MTPRNEDGFSLIETLVAMALLSVLSIGFYQVMYTSVEGSRNAADVSEVAQEARLGFNRMIRDTRETTQLVLAEDDRYRIWVDYDRDELVDEPDFEYLEYAFDGERITLVALTGPPAGDPELLTGGEAPVVGTEPETLADHVGPIEPGRPIFEYVSNFLVFDTIDVDGETSVAELEAGTSGADDGNLAGIELQYISDVNYAFNVSVSDNDRNFFGQAQIRNRRFSDL